MKHIFFYISLVAVLVITNGSNCGGSDPEINYEIGEFPVGVTALSGINSEYDDYNSALPQLTGDVPIQFSSNRESQGADYSFVVGVIYFIFNQTDGDFMVDSEIASIPLYELVANVVNNDRDEFGPYYLFNKNDGLMYFFYTEENEAGNLDIRYVSYFPPAPGELPDITSSDLMTKLYASDSNEGYIAFDPSISTAYFTSDKEGGDFDIFEIDIDPGVSFTSWLKGGYEAGIKNDSINSDYNDKCPFIWNDKMIFTSDRPGGFGGYDLYLSEYVSGSWTAPVNLGPDINSEADEYRPLLGSMTNFSNNFILFSSNRTGGKGGFDLYFTGYNFD